MSSLYLEADADPRGPALLEGTVAWPRGPAVLLQLSCFCCCASCASHAAYTYPWTAAAVFFFAPAAAAAADLRSRVFVLLRRMFLLTI